MASDDFWLDGKPAPRFPIVRDIMGEVILPVSQYLTHRFANGADVKTVEAEAWILRDWFYFLASRRLSWMKPSDDVVRKWKAVQSATGIGRRQVDQDGLLRIVTKIAAVYRFYYVMEHRLGVVQNVIPCEGAALIAELPLKTRLTCSYERSGRTGAVKLVPGVQCGTVPRDADGRPTPSSEEAELVLSAASDRVEPYVGAAHFLIADAKRSCGFRACGIARLTLAAISEGLLKEGIAARRDGSRLSPVDLAGMAEDTGAQNRLLEALNRLKDRKRKNVFVRITEKAKVTRSVAMPIDLLVRNLEFVWNERAEFVARRRARDEEYVAPDHLWLSTKTGLGLTAPAISNLLGEAFKKAKVSGSGHRLRALHVEDIVRDAYLRERARHGRGWDTRTVLFLAAQASGHRNPETLQPYLNNIMKEGHYLGGEPVLVHDEEMAPMVRALVEELNAGNNGVADAFTRFFDERKLAPVPEDQGAAHSRKLWSSRRGALSVSESETS